MATTLAPTHYFDVRGEESRLNKNLIELFNLDIISTTAARKAREKFRQWAKVNAYRQSGTDTGEKA